MGVRAAEPARWLRPLAVASLVSNTAIVVTGGAVRLTGSGLGCPTWPRCTQESFVPHGELDTAIARVCAELAQAPAAAVAMAKQLLNTSFERDFEALLELVKLGNMHLTQTSDFKEAVAAWLQQSGQPRRE